MNSINTNLANDVLLYAQDNQIAKKELVELKNEEKQGLKINDLSTGASSGKKVIFQNGNEFITLKLSDENFKSLQENFRSYTNYVPREDGSIRLNGEAENFISNWFSSVKDMNSKSINSAMNSKNSSFELKFGASKGLNSLAKANEINENQIRENANIEERLNFVIDKDVNKDGKIGANEEKPKTLGQLLTEVKESLNDAAPTIITGASGGKSNEEEESLLEKAQKEGLSSLTPEERAKLEAQNPQKFKELEGKSLEDLSQNLTQSLIEQVKNGETQLVDKLV